MTEHHFFFFFFFYYLTARVRVLNLRDEIHPVTVVHIVYPKVYSLFATQYFPRPNTPLHPTHPHTHQAACEVGNIVIVGFRLPVVPLHFMSGLNFTHIPSLMRLCVAIKKGKSCGLHLELSAFGGGSGDFGHFVALSCYSLGTEKTEKYSSRSVGTSKHSP